MAYLVGGISSAGRSIPPHHKVNFLAARSRGPYVWDQSGRRYTDTALGFGATMLGHAHPAVVDAVCKAVRDGPSPAFAHPGEELAAEALAHATRHLAKVIFTNSGSEAVHLACRLARMATGRAVIAKVAGGYDGWFDDVLFGNAGSTEADAEPTHRPERFRTTLFRYNDFDDIERLFNERSDIAAVLIEPMFANAGCIVPEPGYLSHVEAVARRHGALVIVDEVLMGFRIGFGLASHQLGIEGDLATVGKAIGSGIAVGAVVGRPHIMELAEKGHVLRAGTYSGNPVAAAAVLATLQILKGEDYPTLLRMGETLRTSIEGISSGEATCLTTTGYGSVFTIWLAGKKPRSYGEARLLADSVRSLTLHLELRSRRMLTMPSPFGRLYLSFSHGQSVLGAMADTLAEAVAQIPCLKPNESAPDERDKL